jgi:hypothetical protein
MSGADQGQNEMVLGQIRDNRNYTYYIGKNKRKVRINHHEMLKQENDQLWTDMAKNCAKKSAGTPESQAVPADFDF